MQAVILAAGRGKRITRHSDRRPKSLLKIQGKSIIKHQAEMFIRNGITDIAVVVGYKHDLIQRELEKYKISYIFNPFYEHCNVMGSLWFAKDFLTDSFIFAHADTIFEEEILSRILKKQGDMVLPIDFKKCGKEEMKAKVKGGLVIELNKTMPPEEGEGEFIGVAKVDKKLLPEILTIIDKFLKEGRLNLFFESVIQEIIDRKFEGVKFVDVSGLRWNEIDFEEDYEETLVLFSDAKFRFQVVKKNK